MNIKFKVSNFFDSKAVLDHFGKKGKHTLDALSRAGAFVRQRGKSLLRKRKKSAASGQAPSVHTSDTRLTLRNIQHSYDFASASMLVGTVYAKGRHTSSIPVPRLLELGGVTSRGGKTYRYSAHPWMGPALQKEIAAGTLAECWSANLSR